MNGSAPKSPETGSHVRVEKKCQPNALIDSCECETRTETIRITIAKMLSAQTTIRDANAPSAIRPELFACRNMRITDGVAGANAVGEPISVCGTTVLIIGRAASRSGADGGSSGEGDSGMISGSLMGCTQAPLSLYERNMNRP